MSATSDTEVTSSKEARVYQLSLELEEAKRLKKSAVKGHNEEIKRISAEIKEILKDDVTAASEE